MNSFQVFISHSSDDKRLVEAVLLRLREKLPEIKFWVDYESIRPGDDWADAIIQNLNRSSIFLLFATNTALKSRWAQHEVGAALSKRILDRTPLVILAFNPSALPSDLERYQYIDFTKLDEGLSALEAFLSEEFGAASEARQEAGSIMYRLPPGTVMNFFDCPSTLMKLNRADFRFRITNKLSRQDIAVLWFDALGERMDDEIPMLPKANCAMELLLRVQSGNVMNELINAICKQFPKVARP